MSVLSDVRLSFRTLVSNPGFTAVAVATLALGIGVNATVFTVTNAVLFKGFPLVERNDRLVYITPKESNCCVSYPDFLDYRAQAKSFDGMAIVHGVAKVLSGEKGFPRRTTRFDDACQGYLIPDELKGRLFGSGHPFGVWNVRVEYYLEVTSNSDLLWKPQPHPVRRGEDQRGHAPRC